VWGGNGFVAGAFAGAVFVTPRCGGGLLAQHPASAINTNALIW
jgi:hypothetical protein